MWGRLAATSVQIRAIEKVDTLWPLDIAALPGDCKNQVGHQKRVGQMGSAVLIGGAGFSEIRVFYHSMGTVLSGLELEALEIERQIFVDIGQQGWRLIGIVEPPE